MDQLTEQRTSNMELVTMYKTKDGELFDNAEDAELHEKLTWFFSWYEEHPLYAADGRVHVNAIAKWAGEHKHTLLSILREAQ